MTRAIVQIIEGPDGSGKTYAAEARFAKEHWATRRMPVYVHNGPPAKGETSRSLFHTYMTQLRSAVFNRDRLGVSTIIDRSWPSEVIYGPLYRDGSLLTPRQVAKLERYAAKHNIVTVGLEEVEHVRKRRLEARGEAWDVNQSRVGILYRRYFQSHEGWITANSSLA